MVTMFGFLIIVGAALVMGARWLSHRQTAEESTEEMRASADQFKAEMERSADAVIHRLSSHIRHLETLLQDAEERNDRLERNLAESRRLDEEWKHRSAMLEQDLQEAQRLSRELFMRPAVPPMASVLPEQAGAERVDAQDFAAVLHQSMERDEARNQDGISYEKARQAVGLAAAMESRPSEEQQDAVNEEEPDAVQNTAKARALLLSGYSVEEAARETGMGRGAIELLQEMNRRELENE